MIDRALESVANGSTLSVSVNATEVIATSKRGVPTTGSTALAVIPGNQSARAAQIRVIGAAMAVELKGVWWRKGSLEE